MRCISEFSTSQFKHKNKQQNQIYVQKCDQHSTYSVWWGEKVFTLHIFFNMKHSCTFTCDNVLFQISPSDSLTCCEHADLSEVRRATIHYIQFQVSQHYAITAKKRRLLQPCQGYLSSCRMTPCHSPLSSHFSYMPDGMCAMCRVSSECKPSNVCYGRNLMCDW